MQAPTVPFAAVASAQELELLAEVSVTSGNASEIARRILRRLPAEPGRRSYAYENGFSFHFLTEGRLIFLCMERGVPPPRAFAFLAEMQQSWRTQFAGEPEPEPANPGPSPEPEPRAHQRLHQARAAQAASRTSSSSSVICAPRPSAACRGTTTWARCTTHLYPNPNPNPNPDPNSDPDPNPDPNSDPDLNPDPDPDPDPEP